MIQTWSAAAEDERGERHGARHLDDLGSEEDLPAVEAVREDAAEEREEQKRRVAEEGVEAEERDVDPVIVRISQFCATSCIHVPTLDVKAPAHMRRKSR